MAFRTGRTMSWSGKLQNSYTSFVSYLFQECNSTGLALFRILFGFFMFLDVPQERGLEDADIRFGNPNFCFFPLFSFIQPLPVHYACILYSIMWIGTLGILFGIKFRTSCVLYIVPYLYFFLLDKSRWNNHSYLFALTVVLLSGSNAAKFLSVDSYFDKSVEKRRTCPKWNYFILKFQFFLLYFLAAIKKIDMDWLSGYSMKNLSKHKVLSPFSSFVSGDFVDYYMIHLGGFVFDLTVGFLLNIPCLKKLGFLLSFLFHALNSQLFDIGMFPYVCLASLILFCEPQEFPCSLFSEANTQLRKSGYFPGSIKSREKTHKKAKKYDSAVVKAPVKQAIHVDGAKKWKTAALLTYMLVQVALPFTHSVTKGYNNWTNGLYGYSWDMMVYSWDTLHIKITVKDYVTGDERYLDPDVWTTNDRWSSHADMAKQYSQCIARNLAYFNITTIEIYFDVWKSLNGRFQQRIFDPRVDILKAPWSPWESVPWVLPLLHEFSHWRRDVFEGISKDVANWTKSSNVLFVADYPGLTLENYLPAELTNVSLVLMKGSVVVEQNKTQNVTMTVELNEFDLLSGSQRVTIETDRFHKIHTISSFPSCYMYTYTNSTADRITDAPEAEESPSEPHCLYIINLIKTFISEKFNIFTRSFYLIMNAYLHVFFDVPMVIRKSID